MILKVGTKVLVVHRRLFEKDRERFFVGVVDDCEAAVASVTGYTWSQDQFNGKYIRKEDTRTKIIALSSPGLIIYVLPSTLQLDALAMDLGKEGQVELHDKDRRFRMNLTENCHPVSF